MPSAPPPAQLPALLSLRTQLTLVALVLGAGAAVGQTVGGTVTTAVTTDRLIIKYRASSVAAGYPSLMTMSAAHGVVNRAGAQMNRLRGDAFGGHVMKMDRAVTLDTARRMAREIAAADSAVEYAEPDLILQKMLVPNDASYLSQWQYYETTGGINLPAAWDRTRGAGIVVAVVDTGYRPHVDLAANIVGGWDFISSSTIANDSSARDSDARDNGDGVAAGECGSGQPAQSSSWHGTHVAGTIAALTNNGSGVAGVAYGAKVLPVRVLGKCGGYSSDIADGLVWAAGGTVSGVSANAYPARVINLSLGGSGSCGTTMQNAINTARSRGAVVVVAAGNSATNASTATPANCAGVVTVAAVNRAGGRAFYSNYGSAVDIAAPGGDMRTAATNGILSTLNSGSTSPGADTYAYYQGTSMATPHVAGVAALMLSVKPTLTPDQVESLLKSSARAFPAACSGCGAGIVNAAAAVAAAQAFTTTVSTVAEVESNNTLATAQALSGNNLLVNGSLASSTDTDHFRITIAAGATLTARLTSGSSTGNADLAVYSSSGGLLGSSANGLGVTETMTVRNPNSSATTVVLRVLRGSGTTAASFAYSLSLTQ